MTAAGSSASASKPSPPHNPVTHPSYSATHSNSTTTATTTTNTHPSSSSYNEWKVLPITTLTCIATVIGSGILALPVTMHHTSIPLFLLFFTISLLAQVAGVYAVIELFQRSKAQDEAELIRASRMSSSSPTLSASPSTDTPLSPSNSSSPQATSSPQLSRPVSLYSLSSQYLPNVGLRVIFHLATFFCMIALLVSYGLAGPQALWQLTHPPPAPTTAPPTLAFLAYSGITVLAVIFFLEALLPIFGTLTVVKGSLFTAVVILVASLPARIRTASLPGLMMERDFPLSTAAVPFLMSTVALGGLPNTLPVTFALLPKHATAGQIRRFRGAATTALVVSYLLNVGWVIAVLQMVPRDGSNGLGEAFKKGLISTVPLVATLYSKKGVSRELLGTVEMLVQLFIVVSTGVSFFVVAAGLRSYVQGIAIEMWRVMSGWRGEGDVRRSGRQTVIGMCFTMCFGLVIGLILLNPHGFISMLTGMTSLTMNLQGGVLLILMLYVARTRRGGLGYGNDEGNARNGAGVGGGNDAGMDKLENGGKREIVQDGIAEEMSSSLAASVMVFGGVFSMTACLLATVGPLFGLRLGAPHE